VPFEPLNVIRLSAADKWAYKTAITSLVVNPSQKRAVGEQTDSKHERVPEMNRIYRLIKNRYSGLVQVTPETAKAHGKSKTLTVGAGATAARGVTCMVAALALLGTGQQALAAYITWDGETDANWFVANNWNPNGVPTSADVVRFRSGGTVQVQSAGAVANVLYINDDFNGTSNLAISNGGTVSSTEGYLGFSAPIGGAASIIGRVTVDGAGSNWTNTNALFVGLGGTGMLAISNGGTVSSSIGYIGGDVTADGTVTVDGSGSTWTNTNALYVGVNNTGTLSVTNGGMVTVNGGAGTVRLANGLDASGTLNIGSGGTAGILNAASVHGGNASATLNFNHTGGGYYFTRTGSAGGTAINITGSTAVNHNGSGTTILSGANTYTGTTTVNAGTLSLAGGAAIADTGAMVVNGGGTLNLAVSETIGSLSSAGSVALNANTLTSGGNLARTTLSGGRSGCGGLT
jgi:T5SS/PEP-CTERM-associated repeat protein/autotransporter-associated beta strand protein